MILVRDVKIVETHNKSRFQKIYQYGPTPTIGVYDDGDEFCEVTVEMVKGQRFRNSNGLDVVIGWDKQSQDLLGLPFKAFESMERRRQSDYEENTKLRKKLRKLEETTLWQFLKKRVILCNKMR